MISVTRKPVVAGLLLLLLLGVTYTFFFPCTPPFCLPADSTEQSPNSSLEEQPNNDSETMLPGPYGQNFAPLYDGDQWGYINRDGEWAIQPKYEVAYPFSGGMARVKDNGEWGYIDEDGRWSITPRFGFSRNQGKFTGQPIPVVKEGTWGYVNGRGDSVVAREYQWASDFSEGLAVVQQDHSKGYLNSSGEMVIPAEFDDARLFSEGLAAARKGKYWGYITREGEWAIQPRFEWAKDFKDGLAPVRADDQWGYVNREGNWEIDPDYDFAGTFEQKRALVKKGRFFGYLNPSGETVIPLRYRAAGAFSEGLARVLTEEGWGYVNRTGTRSISPQYEVATTFSNGRARVVNRGRWLYLTNDGDTILPSPLQHQKIRDSNKSSSRLRWFNEMVDRFPWFNPGGQRYYFSPGDDISAWRLSSKPGELSSGMYLVNRYPYENPTGLQYAAAEELLRLSRRLAEQYGWFDYSEGKKLFSNDRWKADPLRAHHLNMDYLQDNRVLDPAHPESLIYYPTTEGRRLASFMFYTDSVRKGPQIGGRLTLWHYHQKDFTRREGCLRHGKHFTPRRLNKSCEALKPVKYTPLMLHVWFIKHRDGPYGSSPELKPYLMQQLDNNHYLREDQLVKMLFCEKCLSDD